ncbi:MAG: response regulator transcription factor [Xanthomonadales bacterium]|nr:response regulator transcription factor [Xanthomonadales bacterium]
MSHEASPASQAGADRHHGSVRALTVALLEDEPHTRAAIAAKLAQSDGIELIASLATLAEMRASLQQRQPDVLIVDLELPDGSGLDLIAFAHARWPAMHILVLTVLDDEHKVIAAIERGADGYLLKDEGAIALLDAVFEVSQGGSPISPAIARHLVRRLAAQAPNPDASISLSERERQVLQLAAKGYAYAEVAKLLGIGVSTVASYTRHIYEKLQVDSRSGAVYEATRLGLIDPR